MRTIVTAAAMVLVLLASSALAQESRGWVSYAVSPSGEVFKSQVEKRLIDARLGALRLCMESGSDDEINHCVTTEERPDTTVVYFNCRRNDRYGPIRDLVHGARRSCAASTIDPFRCLQWVDEADRRSGAVFSAMRRAESGGYTPEQCTEVIPRERR